MATKTWDIVAEGVMHKVEVELECFSGKLTVKIDGDTFELPPKFLTFLIGRREQFTLSDKPAILKIKPFGKVTVIVGGNTYE